jgi:hypothetical protein
MAAGRTREQEVNNVTGRVHNGRQVGEQEVKTCDRQIS